MSTTTVATPTASMINAANKVTIFMSYDDVVFEWEFIHFQGRMTKLWQGVA